MERAREELLAELAAYGREHDAALAERLKRLRNVEPETGAMMSVLARASRARRLLELGTSNGYSTVWLGDAAEANGGSLLSVDFDASRTALAQRTIARAGLGGVVQLRTEDAARTLAGLEDGACDFIFLDAERPAYASYWPHLVRVLGSPGLLVVDNAISHAAELEDFSAIVGADGRVVCALVPVGAGTLLVAAQPSRR